MTLIIGGSGSGKSFYAENYIEMHGIGTKMYYIATMKVDDRESLEIVKRHRKMRETKPFLTIEQPNSIGDALDKMERGEKSALLESMSTLAANEMFQNEKRLSKEKTVQIIMNGISALKENVREFVIVSDYVFADGGSYDLASTAYRETLGRLNCEIALMAEHVIEVVAGIPIVLKGGRGR